MYVALRGIFQVKTMTPTSLRQLVELWREVNSTKHHPSTFISQKFKNCEDDKLEVYEGRMALDQEEDGEGVCLHQEAINASSGHQ